MNGGISLGLTMYLSAFLVISVLGTIFGVLRKNKAVVIGSSAVLILTIIFILFLIFVLIPAM